MTRASYVIFALSVVALMLVVGVLIGIAMSGGNTTTVQPIEVIVNVPEATCPTGVDGLGGTWGVTASCEVNQP